MTYRGVVRNGLVELADGASLPDGTLVHVEPADAASPDGPVESAGGGVFSIGRRAVKTGLPDLATNIDHYLYGHPKVRDGQE